MSSERARRLRFSYRIPGRSYDTSAAVVVTFTLGYYIYCGGIYLPLYLKKLLWYTKSMVL